MKTIHHVFQITAARATVFAALTTSAGISGWWTTNVQADSAAEVDAPALVDWECVAGAAPWLGSHLHFDLVEHDGGTRVRFSQNYATEPDDDTTGSANFHWVSALDSLRRLSETGVGEPFPSPPAPDGRTS